MYNYGLDAPQYNGNQNGLCLVFEQNVEGYMGEVRTRWRKGPTEASKFELVIRGKTRLKPLLLIFY